MKLFIFFLLFVFFSSCSSNKELLKTTNQNKLSQQDTISNYFIFDYINTLTEDDFLSKLDSIKDGTSEDFFTLRMAYTKTKNYSPYAIDISDSLDKVRALIDSSDYEKALSLLNSIIEKNFVNITSHLYCGYIFKELDDSLRAEFHYKIYDGLLNSIYESGDGRSPKTAFLVISTKEEYDLLNWFSLQSNGQSLIDADGYSFDLMDVADQQTAEKYEIYFNIELPYSNMKKMFSK